MDIAQFLDFFGLRWSDKKQNHLASPTAAGDNLGGGDPESQAFEKRFKAILAESQEVSTGQVQFIELGPIRERLGERWGQMAERIHAMASRVIAKHLTDADVYSRYDEFDYLLVFSGLDKDTSALKCAKIAEEIYQGLLGSEGLAELKIRSLVAVADGELIFQEKSLDACIEAVATGLDTVRAKSPQECITIGGASKQKGEDKPPIAPSHERNARDESLNAGIQSGDRSDAISHQNIVEEQRNLAEPPMTVQPTKHDAQEIDRTLAPESQERPWQDQIDFVYLPTWNVRQQAITSYYCTPRRRAGSKTLFGYSVVAGVPTDEKTAYLDSYCLENSIEVLTELVANSIQFLMVLSVDYSTLVDPKLRREYIRICKRIPLDIRRYFAVEIVEHPPSVPGSRLIELVTMLKPFFGIVMLRTSLAEDIFQKGQYAKFNALGIDVAREQLEETELLHALDQFARSAEESGVASYILGVASRSLVLAASAAGFWYIRGPAIKGPTEIPSHVTRYSWENYYLEGMA